MNTRTSMIIDFKATGTNIFRLREAVNLSVKDLQDLFGFSTPQAIYKWQNGKTIPTIEHLVILSGAFQVRIDEILVLVEKSKDLAESA